MDLQNNINKRWTREATIGEDIAILHFENDPKRIKALEEMEIMKATTTDHMLNIMQNINLLYRMLQPLQDQTTTTTDKC